jgi:DNA-binding transcriptional regulator YiaG
MKRSPKAKKGRLQEQRTIDQRNIVRFSRKRLRLRHTELGKLAGVHYQKLRRWEAGEGNLSEDEIRRIVEALDFAFIPEFFNITKEERDRKTPEEIAVLRSVMDQKKTEMMNAKLGPYASMTREVFKKLRQDHAITQAAVADEWGRNQSEVASYEGGYALLLSADQNAMEAALLRLIDRIPKKYLGPLGDVLRRLDEGEFRTQSSTPPEESK